MSSLAADNGIVTVPTQRTVDQAADALASLIEAKNIILFARIDFAADAQRAGLAMPPSQLLVFGNPRAGTPLMQADQTIGIDLPLKLLVWEDGAGKVWVSYNDPVWLGVRHGLPGSEGDRLKGMAAGLQAIASAAAAA